jgi:ABC-type multidrug transport system ATPase subunit
LRKVYLTGAGPCDQGAPLRAVERLSFGLSKGECFALLGVNGAGKSTTFKVLTMEEEATSGSITVQGMDMKKEFEKVRKLIGYCPQYNPIFETLSVEQNIEYFAKIKGIPNHCRDQMIETVIDKLGLQIHR